MGKQVNRRQFLGQVGAGALGAGAGLLAGEGLLEQVTQASEVPMRLPQNVLLIMADDLGPEGLSCFGGEIKTPNIDALAKSGMMLNACFATPICTPSRVQLLTGQYPCHNGWSANMFTYPVKKQVVDPETFNLAQLFKQSGYRTAIAGKWQLCRFHKYPNHITQMGFDRHLVWTWRISDDAKEKKKSRYWAPYIWENGKLAEQYRKEENFGPDLYTEYLKSFMLEKTNQPFFAYFPMTLPHKPFVTTPDEPEVQGNIPRYKAMVRYMDKQVGVLIDALKKARKLENTLVIFTTDNGSPKEIQLERQGKKIKGGKFLLSDAGTRVPTVMAGPGVKQGVKTDALVDFTDFMPTFASMIGRRVPKAHPVDGVDLMPLLSGKEKKVRDWVYVQKGDEAAVRGPRYKLYNDGRFYDVDKDPLEKKPIAKPKANAGKAMKELAAVSKDFPTFRQAG